MTDLVTAQDMFESLTGFEELAIEKHFQTISVTDLANTKPTMLTRALVFVQHIRAGKQPGEAKTSAMALTMKELEASFADETPDDEFMPGQTGLAASAEPEPTQPPS